MIRAARSRSGSNPGTAVPLVRAGRSGQIVFPLVGNNLLAGVAEINPPSVVHRDEPITAWLLNLTSAQLGTQVYWCQTRAPRRLTLVGLGRTSMARLR